MIESILTLIKKMVGIEPDYTHFDTDIIIYINSAIFSLSQLGVTSADGFLITDASKTWVDLLGDSTYVAAAQTFIFLKVKLWFDPPTNSFVTEAMERQIKDLEWRINVECSKEGV